MNGHSVRFKVHGTTEMRVHAEARSNTPHETVLHITCGLTTLCMCMSAEDMRGIAHVLTLAADESEMPPIPAGEATDSDFGAFQGAL